MTHERTHLPAVDLALDLLKLLRSFWLTQAEIAAHYQVTIGTVSRLATKMVENGYLVCESRPSMKTGRATLHYSVAPMWKGPVQ